MHRATRESVAYDLARFDNRSTVRQAADVPLRQVRTGKRKKNAISFSMALSYFMVLFIAGVIVFSYMQVTMLSDQSSKLQEQIEKLAAEETTLRAQQEKMYNLNYIEEYAKNNLNMVKADKSQIEYVEMAKPDQIRIIKGGREKAPNYFSGFIKSFNVVVEYLN